jgi:hypothetical protein
MLDLKIHQKESQIVKVHLRFQVEVMEIELGQTAIFSPGSEIVVLCGEKPVEFYENLRRPVANLEGGFLIPLKRGENPQNPDRYDEEETRFKKA